MATVLRVTQTTQGCCQNDRSRSVSLVFKLKADSLLSTPNGH